MEKTLDPDGDATDWSSASIPEEVSRPWQTWANEILTHFAQVELEPSTMIDKDYLTECESICQIKDLKEAFQLSRLESKMSANNQSLRQLAIWSCWKTDKTANLPEFIHIPEDRYKIPRWFFLESGPQSKFAKIAMDTVPDIGSSRDVSEARRKRKRKVNLSSYFESKRNDGASNLCSQ